MYALDGLRTSDGVCDHGRMQDRPPLPPGRRVEADLRARIAAGEWSSGERLPAIPELAEHYRTARGTVAAALRRIAADGLIEIVPSWGTFRK